MRCLEGIIHEMLGSAVFWNWVFHVFPQVLYTVKIYTWSWNSMHFHFFHLKCAFTALPIGLATSNPNSYSRITLPVPFYHSDNLICAPHIPSYQLYQGRLPAPLCIDVLDGTHLAACDFIWPLTLIFWTNSRNLLFVRCNMTPSQVLNTILLFQSVGPKIFPNPPPIL